MASEFALFAGVEDEGFEAMGLEDSINAKA
jgi:hypothetical protein